MLQRGKDMINVLVWMCLFIQYAKLMRRILLSSVAYLNAPKCISHYLLKNKILWNELLCVISIYWFPQQHCP